jgi:hypothetical protein
MRQCGLLTKKEICRTIINMDRFTKLPLPCLLLSSWLALATAGMFLVSAMEPLRAIDAGENLPLQEAFYAQDPAPADCVAALAAG